MPNPALLLNARERGLVERESEAGALARSPFEEARARIRENEVLNELLNFGESRLTLEELTANHMQRRIEARKTLAQTGRASILFDVIRAEEAEDALMRREYVLLRNTRGFADLMTAKRFFASLPSVSNTVKQRIVRKVQEQALAQLVEKRRQPGFWFVVSGARNPKLQQIGVNGSGVLLLKTVSNALKLHAERLQPRIVRR
ncbi:MAG: hypothetical protein V1817_01800 [Candidatus Micrarchaeota archaeon]